MLMLELMMMVVAVLVTGKSFLALSFECSAEEELLFVCLVARGEEVVLLVVGKGGCGGGGEVRRNGCGVGSWEGCAMLMSVVRVGSTGRGI
jgi:hypothetical protein